MQAPKINSLKVSNSVDEIQNRQTLFLMRQIVQLKLMTNVTIKLCSKVMKVVGKLIENLMTFQT